MCGWRMGTKPHFCHELRLRVSYMASEMGGGRYFDNNLKYESSIIGSVMSTEVNLPECLSLFIPHLGYDAIEPAHCCMLAIGIITYTRDEVAS